MSGISGILGTRQTIGRLDQTGGFRAAAAQVLHRAEIKSAIAGVISGFQAPIVNERRTVSGPGETIDRTLGDVLWTAQEDHAEAFAALRGIVWTNLRSGQLTLNGVKDLGETFGPFHVRDYLYWPMLLRDTAATRTILAAGGLTRLESADGLDLTPVLAAYAVKDGTIVTDWRNAKNIMTLISWAAEASLAFLPYYQALSDVEFGNPAGRAMEQIINYCQLGGRNLSLFWLGRSSVPAAGGAGWMPQVAVIDPVEKIILHHSLRGPQAPQTAAILLTLVAGRKIA